jgi:hypothetical protein
MPKLLPAVAAGLALVAAQPVSAANPFVGNTLQAKVAISAQACLAAGQCKSVNVPPTVVHVYFSTNGNAYDYVSTAQGAVYPFNRMIDVPNFPGRQQGMFLRGSSAEYQQTQQGLRVWIVFRVKGSRCTAVTHLETTIPGVQLSSSTTTEYCRVVQGRVER